MRIVSDTVLSPSFSAGQFVPACFLMGLLIVLPAGWMEGALQTHGVAAAASYSADGTIRKLEGDIPELMKKGNVPGLAIAVIRKGKTSWMRGFGVKETKTGVLVTEDTIFEAASLSKPVLPMECSSWWSRGS